jgi:hypothetical protein
LKPEINLQSLLKKRSGLISFLILFLVSIALVAPYYPRFLAEPIVGGVDGDAHFRVVEYYAQHIFPQIYGFVPNANAGFPWPIAYPPLSSMLLAGIFQVTTIDMLVFKLIFIALLALTPWLFSRVYLAIDNNKFRGLAAGLFYTVYVAGAVETTGPNFFGTILNGIYPQLLGFVVFLIWLKLLVEQSHALPNLKITIAFTLLYLSNVHLAEAAVVIWLVRFLFAVYELQDKRGIIINYLKFGLLSLGLGAFWLLPLFSTAQFFQAVTLQSVPTNHPAINIGIIGWGGFLISAVVTFSCIHRRIYKPLVQVNIALLALVLISILPINLLLPGLPIQPIRIIEVPIILSLLNIPILCEILVGFAKNRLIHILLTLSVLSIAFVVNRPYLSGPNSHEYVQLSKSELQLAEYIQSIEQGRSLVEAWQAWVPEIDTVDAKLGQYTHMLLASTIGSYNHETLWGVFRESSLNSTFTQSIRNGLSSEHEESYGIESYLSFDPTNKNLTAKHLSKYLELINQPLPLHVARARLYGVKYYIVRSSATKQLLADEGPQLGIELDRTFGSWQVFKDNYPASLAQEVELPTLVFTSLLNRSRPEDGYDWLRLNEELIFTGRTDQTLALAQNQYLDKTTDFKYFAQSFIAEYKYSNIDNAYSRLIDYARGNKLFVLESVDPLFLRLAASQLPNVIVIPRNGPNQVITELVSQLPEIIPNSGIELSVRNNSQTLIIDQIKQKPVLLKYAYFPWWQAEENNAKIYMASPALMLVISGTERVTINFQSTNNVTMLGLGITTLSIGVVLTRKLIYKRRNR